MSNKAKQSVTVYVALRPFEGDWIDKNEAVLAGLRWQGVELLTVKLVCWPSEVSTVRYASEQGYKCVVVPWSRHYLFPGPQRSFKSMFEVLLADCSTDVFVYINGDIVLGPGIIEWLQGNVDHEAMYCLPRHNWVFDQQIKAPKDFECALGKALPEEWTGVDLFAMIASDGRKGLLPIPPFLLSAGSMDSWLVAKAGQLGWRRVLLPPERYAMLHIEHPPSHPLKKGASSVEKVMKWSFNCGVYALAVQGMPPEITADTSMICFEGAKRYARKFGVPKGVYRPAADVVRELGLHQEG